MINLDTCRFWIALFRCHLLLPIRMRCGYCSVNRNVLGAVSVAGRVFFYNHVMLFTFSSFVCEIQRFIDRAIEVVKVFFSSLSSFYFNVLTFIDFFNYT